MHHHHHPPKEKAPILTGCRVKTTAGAGEKDTKRLSPALALKEKRNKKKKKPKREEKPEIQPLCASGLVCDFAGDEQAGCLRAVRVILHCLPSDGSPSSGRGAAAGLAPAAAPAPAPFLCPWPLQEGAQRSLSPKGYTALCLALSSPCPFLAKMETSHPCPAQAQYL